MSLTSELLTWRNKTSHSRPSWYSFPIYTRLIQTQLEVKDSLARSMSKGDLFLVNFDDSDLIYEDVFDPDFREFYNESCLPQHLFYAKELSIPEVQRRVMAETDCQNSQPQEKVSVVLWSKFKVEGSISDEKIEEKIQRRFQLALPLAQFDFIILDL